MNRLRLIALPAIFTCYSTGLSAFVKIKNIDQRIFGFVTPFWKHAALFGAIVGVVYSSLEIINQHMTHTNYYGTERGLAYGSEHPTIYRTFRLINLFIAGVASQKAIQMVFHVNIPLEFVGLFAIPLIVTIFPKDLKSLYNQSGSGAKI